MKILVLILTLTFFFTSPAAAQEEEIVKIKDYLDFAVGDGWRYKNLAPDGLSPILINVSGREKFNNEKVYRRDENNGDYRFQKFDKEGLKIYQLYFVGERVIKYEKPVLLMPAKMRLGQTHRNETAYQTFVKGELKETGQQTYEVTAERFENIKTAFGECQNCFLLRTVALRTDASGAQKGYELREWHQKDVGAVKITGELFWKNAKGETTRTFKINAELEARYGISTSFTKNKKSIDKSNLSQPK